VEAGVGHNILAPDPASEHTATSNDVAMLLSDLVRLGERVLLLDPLAPPSGCAACAAAYSSAWDVVRAAGGVTAWIAEFEGTRTC
jgi:hypothetical protein